MEAGRANDGELTNEKITEWHRKVYMYLIARCPKVVAEDITQDTILACIQSREEIRNLRYVIQRAEWEYLDWLKRVVKREVSLETTIEGTEGDLQRAPETGDPYSDVASWGDRIDLESAMKTLTTQCTLYKDVCESYCFWLNMAYVQELTLEEMTKETGVPKSTADRRIKSCLNKLRSAFDPSTSQRKNG